MIVRLTSAVNFTVYVSVFTKERNGTAGSECVKPSSKFGFLRLTSICRIRHTDWTNQWKFAKRWMQVSRLCRQPAAPGVKSGPAEILPDTGFSTSTTPLQPSLPQWETSAGFSLAFILTVWLSQLLGWLVIVLGSCVPRWIPNYSIRTGRWWK